MLRSREVPMRYLYGDSAPFPHSFNFLSTLEAFMAAAARIVQLESESYDHECHVC